jgi:hypothetical protein
MSQDWTVVAGASPKIATWGKYEVHRVAERSTTSPNLLHLFPNISLVARLGVIAIKCGIIPTISIDIKQ